MIRILFVVCNNVVHGTERYVLDILQNIDKEKFAVAVATPEYGPLSELLKNIGVEEIIYENSRMNKFTVKGALKLFGKIRSRNFDIIHANAGIIPNILGKLLSVKVNIESKHGILIPEEILNNLSIKRKLHEKMKEYFVDFFIAESENDKEKMVKYFNIKSEKIKVVYNGINLGNNIFKEPEADNVSQNNCDELIIGTIGRLTYQKGQDILIEAFSKAAAKIKFVKLLILGSGEDENKLLQIAAKCGVKDKVVIKKYCSNIKEFLTGLDIFILTSRYEGVPYVLLEAMNIGVPIITTRVGGIDNIISNRKNGLLIEKDNILETESAILELSSNKELRRILAKNAIAEVRKYSVKNMTRNTEILYREKYNQKSCK